MKTAIKLLLYFLLNTSAYAEVLTDGTVGAQQSLSGQMVIPQSLGTTVGNNLFHSFNTFNINAGESATFTGSNSLKNVISRVTGGNSSTINGLLRSTIGNANFYFINPAGVTFAANAQVDVPAAFHVSTADSLKFSDGSEFSASNPDSVSTLQIAEPASFGFLGSRTNNGMIEIKATSPLTVNTGQTLDLVAGNITIKNNATLFAPAGEVRLVATQGQSEVSLVRDTNNNLPLSTLMPSLHNAGKIILDSGNIDTIGDGGGRIALWGGKISFKNSTAFADNDGDKDAGVGKSVAIQANSLDVVDSSYISFDALSGTGKAGDITVKATDSVTILNEGIIKSSTYAQGDAGNITITADKLHINRQKPFADITGIFTEASIDDVIVEPNTGNAGNVIINANTIDILNGGAIQSSTITQANSGNIYVNAKTLTIDNKNSFWLGGIYSLNADVGFTSGNSGDLIVKAEKIDILNGGVIYSATHGQGNAGNISVTTDRLKIDNQTNLFGVTGIVSDAQENSSGHAGTVDVNAGTLNILHGGQISSSTFSQGNAGSVTVTADSLTIDNQTNLYGATGIFSNAEDNIGNAGSISVTAGTLNIFDGGEISSSTFSQGNAGSILVTANILTLDSQGFSDWGTGIFSQANSVSSGDANTINVNAKSLAIMNGGLISSSTRAQGKAGDILVTADRLEINGQNSLMDTGILAQANTNSSGYVGNITVNASSAINLSNNGKISIENFSTAGAPNEIPRSTITINAPDIAMKNSSISTTATGNVSAGNIVVNFAHWLTMDPSFITTTANTGNGGDITIYGGELIYLQNSGFLTSVHGLSSDGGNINVTANALVMNNGVIQANAVGGSGGDIQLNLNAAIPSHNQLQIGGRPVVWQPYQAGFNLIQAASETGVSGSINNTSPQFNISGSISGLDTRAVILPSIIYDPCLTTAILRSSLIHNGRGGIPVNETTSSFIPPAIEAPNSKVNFKNWQRTKPVAIATVKSTAEYSCLQPVSVF